ncbi:MAG TPA: Stf0 family sulfotransferase [Caulobacteraceae bacterium]|nr:Stf0 family sulfotransferase [Caulobacteraceae bacterium]
MTQRGYAICSEPRSGTTWLTYLLSSTGVLGHPREYFNPTNEAVRDIEGYGPDRMIETVLTRGRTDNGVYAVKVFTDTFDNPAQPWAKTLPNLSFVHFEREDLLGQAISWAKAVQTGLYLATDEKLGEAHYDQAAITWFLVEGARRQARWRLFFARNGLEPLRLTYSGLTADPVGAVHAVARLVQVEPPSVDPAKAATKVQRDDVSEAWRQRYQREMGDLARLDEPDVGGPLALRRLLSRARQKLRRLSGR